MSTNPTDAQLHIADKDGNYIFVHPETNFTQVLEQSTGKNLEDYLKENVGTVLKGVPYSLVATTANQTTFTFEDNLFNPNEIVSVYLNGEFMHPGEEYSITKTNSTVTIVLADGVDTDDRLFVYIHRNFKVVNDQIPVDFSTVPDHSIDEIKINYTKDKFGFYHVGGVKYFDKSIGIYIDPVNGNDDNNGSIDKPIKSLEYLSSILSNTRSMSESEAYISVGLVPGTYKGVLYIRNFDFISLTNVDNTKPVIFDTVYKYFDANGYTQYASMVFDNGKRLTISNNIKVAPVVNSSHPGTYMKLFVGTSIQTLTFSNFTMDWTNVDAKYSNTPNTGFRIDYSNVVMLDTKFIGLHVPIYSDGGRIRVEGGSFTNCGSIHASYFTTYSELGAVRTNPKNPGAPIISDNGIDLGMVKNGIITEYGYNANGEYYIYANGRLEVIVYKHLPSVSLAAGESKMISGVYPFSISNPNNGGLVYTNVTINGPMIKYVMRSGNSNEYNIEIYNDSGHPFTGSVYLGIHGIGRWK